MKKLIFGAVAVLGLASAGGHPAWAICNATSVAPALTAGSQPCSMDLSGNMRTISSGSTTANGSIGTAGTNGTVAQSIQGVSGGVPLGVFAQSNASGTYGNSSVQSAAIEGSHVLKASAGNLYEFDVTTTTAGFVMIFNAITAPVDGAVTPQRCFAIPIGTFQMSTPIIPEIFTTGVTAVFSTTGCFTKTIAADAFFHANVK